MMPASNAFSGFTTTGESTTTSSLFNVEGNFDFGWNFKTGVDTDDNPETIETVHFPTLGVRSRSSGDIYDVKIEAESWNANANSVNYAYHLSSTAQRVSPNNRSSRACGFPVRPVQE